MHTQIILELVFKIILLQKLHIIKLNHALYNLSNPNFVNIVKLCIQRGRYLTRPKSHHLRLTNDLS